MATFQELRRFDYVRFTDKSKDIKMTSLFLAEKWCRVEDTVSALNCHLASSVAKDRQHKTCCVVLTATDEEKKDAADYGVELILPRLRESVYHRYKNDKPSPDWFLSPETFFTSLAEVENVKYIVEHVQSSTKLLVSNVFREHYCKDANIVLINHAVPSTGVKDQHLKFAEQASAVFSVGPVVFEHYKNLYDTTKIPINHELYLPRPEKAFFDLNVDGMTKTSSLNQILTVMTDTDVESSRYKRIAAEVGVIADRFKFMCQKVPLWCVRTASGADLDNTKNVLTNNLNSSCMKLTTYPPYGSQDDIYRDLCQSNVCIIPPDEPFRMEGLQAIAAGLPVLIPSDTALAEYIKTCFGQEAEYFLYDPSVDGDLSQRISDMLNMSSARSKAAHLRNAFLSHTAITETHLMFRTCLKEGQGSLCEFAITPQLPIRIVQSPSTDDGLGTIEDSCSSNSMSPPPENIASPESLVFPDGTVTRETHKSSLLRRKRPLMPTLQCKVNMELEEKKMMMEMAKMDAEREHKKMEVKMGILKQKEKEIEFEMEKLKQKEREIELEQEKKEKLINEIKDLYEIEKKRIVDRNDPDLVEQLDEAYEKYKARLDAVVLSSLWFLLSFLSEQDIDYFWQKYNAGEVEEMLGGILITSKMRSLAEEAGCIVRIRMKIDRKEYETVKQILHDISAVYTIPEKTWARTLAYDERARYVLDHVEETQQAKYLIEQSRFHPIVGELRSEEFLLTVQVYVDC